MAAPDTGVGTTVALTTTTFTAKIVNVSEILEAVESLDITHLGLARTDEALKMAGDNPNVGSVTIVYQFSSEESPPRAGALAQDTLTITLPVQTTGNGTNFSIVLTGFIMSNTVLPPLARNTVNQGTMVFEPDGATVTITAEAA